LIIGKTRRFGAHAWSAPDYSLVSRVSADSRTLLPAVPTTSSVAGTPLPENPSLRCFWKRRETIGCHAPGDRGADIFRACVDLPYPWAPSKQQGGPTLARIFGRRIATGCRANNFSESSASRYRLDAGDSFQSCSNRTFSLHPRYQEPEQRISSEQDRAALVQFS